MNYSDENDNDDNDNNNNDGDNDVAPVFPYSSFRNSHYSTIIVMDSKRSISDTHTTNRREKTMKEEVEEVVGAKGGEGGGEEEGVGGGEGEGGTSGTGSSEPPANWRQK
ncbi:hypothetical protein HZH68_013399 [Vespula germanica]|uniref:Uncharacterized protein n=1 Tax=Vespula germanica TaxID=30212 RepID=A0A834MUW8_VESGE|nr:hypothetical protein HZH68_013399 [Vespula germanica]